MGSVAENDSLPLRSIPSIVTELARLVDQLQVSEAHGGTSAHNFTVVNGIQSLARMLTEHYFLDLYGSTPSNTSFGFCSQNQLGSAA